MLLFNVLSFLIVEYICIVYHSLDCFVLVIVIYSSLFILFFAEILYINVRMHAYTKFFSNKKIYF